MDLDLLWKVFHSSQLIVAFIHSFGGCGIAFWHSKSLLSHFLSLHFVHLHFSVVSDYTGTNWLNLKRRVFQ